MLTAKRVKFSLPFFEKDNKHEYFVYISARLTIQQGLEEVLQAMLLFAERDKVVLVRGALWLKHNGRLPTGNTIA